MSESCSEQTLTRIEFDIVEVASSVTRCWNIKVVQKVVTVVFTLKGLFQTAQKVTKYLGYFCKYICDHDFSKITQSGHTELASRSSDHIKIIQSVYLEQIVVYW